MPLPESLKAQLHALQPPPGPNELDRAARAGNKLSRLYAEAVLAQLRQQGMSPAAIRACGGGAHNLCMLERLRRNLPACHVATTAALGMDPDWVEAIAFAWLAKQTLDGRPGNLAAVTGAAGERVLGAIYPA